MCKPCLIERVAAQQIAKLIDIERMCRGQPRCSLALKQSPESISLGRDVPRYHNVYPYAL